MPPNLLTPTRLAAQFITMCLTTASVWAQTPATPPALADMALQGNLLQAVQKNSQADCQAACAATAGCSGYTLQVPGYAREPAKANCALYGGAVSEMPAVGSVSCRMPCTPPLSLSAGSKGLMLNKPLATLQVQPTATRAAPLLNKLGTGQAAASVAPPPPPPAPQALGVAGYEIVVGPQVDVAPLSSAETSAQCPAGKVALSAGVDFTAAGNASFGLEVRGAWPIDRLATVRLRNANVFEPGRARAIAVCVDAIPAMRTAYFDAGTPGQMEAPTTRLGACASGERLIGGGVMGREDTVIASNAPSSAGFWQSTSVRASPVSLPGTVNIEARTVCAPRAQVDGWEYLETPEVTLGARSQASLNLACTNGKVMLAAGVVERSLNALDIVVNSVILNANGTASAHLHNRNTLNSAGSVRAVLTGICARRQ
jgi:hypothetical protein